MDTTKPKSDANIIDSNRSINVDALLSLQQEKPSNYSLSSASMVDTIQYEKLDVGFLFEINFKVFLKETRDIKVMCISSQHQFIQSKPTSMFREISEQIIERRWIIITYFALRFLLDSVLVYYFNHPKQALLSNFLSIALIYGLLIFYKKVAKTQKYFSEIESDVRIQSKLKEFYGKESSVDYNYHDTYMYTGGADHIEAVNRIQEQIHNNDRIRRKAIETGRNSDRRNQSIESYSVPVTHHNDHQYSDTTYELPPESAQHYQQPSRQQQPPPPSYSSPPPPSSYPTSQRSSQKSPLPSSSSSSSSSSVGGLFKGFRTRKIMQQAIILQEEKDRLMKLAFDALQLPLPPSFGYNGNHEDTTGSNTANTTSVASNTTGTSSSAESKQASFTSRSPNRPPPAPTYHTPSPSPTKSAYHAPSPSLSPQRNNSIRSRTVTTDDGHDGDDDSNNGNDSRHIQINDDGSNNNTAHMSARTLAVERHLSQSLSLSSSCPFTGHKASFDPHVFFNFEFVDVEPISRNMCTDRSYAHTFKARGANYFQDKIKIDPGPAVCKLMLMELYEVETHKEPDNSKDRHDHVASRGLSRERVQVLRNLPGKPFIIVLNFQIPGDPPVSLVAYFAVPPDVRERFPGVETERFLKLLQEYINIPTNEIDRRALWGLPPTNEAIAGANVAASVAAAAESNGKLQANAVTGANDGDDHNDEDDLFEAFDGDEDDTNTTITNAILTNASASAAVMEKITTSPNARHLDSSAPPIQINHLRHVDSSAPPTPAGTTTIPLSIQTATTSTTTTDHDAAFPQQHIKSPNSTKASKSANSTPLKGTKASQLNSTNNNSDSNQPQMSRQLSSPAVINSTHSIPITTPNTVPIIKETSSASPATAATSSGGGGLWGMKIPVDIVWPDGTEPGTYPQSDFRNSRFKMIPTVTEGPWVIKTAVPSKPGILGRKVIVRYFRGDGYMETDIHVGSSVVAAQITGLCRGYGKHFAADLGIMLEPTGENELPEKLLACVGINKIDIDIRQKLD